MTPTPTLERLLTALEELTQREETLFKNGQYLDSIAVQQRAMPVATEIASLVVAPGVARALDPALQVRIHELLRRRQAHYELVSTKVTEAAGDLKKLSEAEARARLLRPAYGEKAPRFAVASFAAEG